MPFRSMDSPHDVCWQRFKESAKDKFFLVERLPWWGFQQTKDFPKTVSLRAGLFMFFRRFWDLQLDPQNQFAANCWGYRSTSWAEATFFWRVLILAGKNFRKKNFQGKNPDLLRKPQFSQLSNFREFVCSTFWKIHSIYIYTYWVVPLPSNSHH